LLTESGGVTTSLDDNGMTRAPLFEAADLKAARALLGWVREHEATLAVAAEATSSHLKWQGIETHMMGRLVWIRMRFGTEEAMGMNMATIAARAVSDLICEHTGVELLALSGNLCADKKPSHINVVAGRGFSVQAEASLPAELVERILHTDYRRMARVARAKNWYGSGLGGALGANAQAANVVAAVFIATGQDAAHIVDSSTCFTVVEAEDDALYVSVTLPNILVGSVGGGTSLTAQRSARRLMTSGLGKSRPADSESRRLAEILAATVLAGEISLLGALSAGHLDKAHQALARGRSK
jgi:hydroxymethylglutaryl-CoA reductase (NADPH)